MGLLRKKHWHIIETAITLLTNVALPIEFWHFACAHSIYHINRMPCNSLSMNLPYRMLYKKSPFLSLLRIFGTVVYPWLRPWHSNKLQARSVLCIFLGYSQGYKRVICYNLESKKFILSRHVIFYETVFPKKSKRNLSFGLSIDISEPTPKHVVIPILVPLIPQPQGDSLRNQS